MKHHEGHNHNLPDPGRNISAAFITGIALNFLFVLIEAVVGFSVNSLSLLSDAGHNLTDVVTLALSLLAFSLMKVKSSEQYTYGYRKTSILVALFNTMFLLISIGAIVYEAIHRLINPAPTSGTIIAAVAAAGIVINSVTAFMFLRSKDKDINIRSAYLHLLGDALISAGIVAGGIIIYYTSWYWVDSAFSILVAIAILFSAWKLLRSSLRLSLDGVPAYISMDEIVESARQIRGIKSIHHIHIWAISTTENALTAHLVLEPGNDGPEEQKIKHDLREALGRKNIHHVTLETEREDEECRDKNC